MKKILPAGTISVENVQIFIGGDINNLRSGLFNWFRPALRQTSTGASAEPPPPIDITPRPPQRRLTAPTPHPGYEAGLGPSIDWNQYREGARELTPWERG